ncbi:hypothetical protein ES288_A07G048600v1 [Gossypium darwinii]|uniref:Uncharacterized protein n=1 Tax=Gossypium darwinii TaxID=34276 RepID=A0A5D2FVZ6_GOSDA|nr:hypothetical protein ES288_A07G048600v1 [Gossypium darwinii]
MVQGLYFVDRELVQPVLPFKSVLSSLSHMLPDTTWMPSKHFTGRESYSHHINHTHPESYLSTVISSGRYAPCNLCGLFMQK